MKISSSISVVEESTPPVITSDGSRYIPHHRIVHFDLKGAPPKLSYFKELFPVIREAGATAILLGKVQFFTDLRRLIGNFYFVKIPHCKVLLIVLNWIFPLDFRI